MLILVLIMTLLSMQCILAEIPRIAVQSGGAANFVDVCWQSVKIIERTIRDNRRRSGICRGA